MSKDLKLRVTIQKIWGKSMPEWIASAKVSWLEHAWKSDQRGESESESEDKEKDEVRDITVCVWEHVGHYKDLGEMKGSEQRMCFMFQRITLSAVPKIEQW